MNLFLLIFYGTVFVIMGGIAALLIVRMTRSAFGSEKRDGDEED